MDLKQIPAWIGKNKIRLWRDFLYLYCLKDPTSYEARTK